MFWHYPHYHTEGAVPYSAVRFKNFKLIHNLENDSIELYNLENDVAEKFNIAFENEKLSNQLFEMLQKWKITVNAQDPLKNLSFKK